MVSFLAKSTQTDVPGEKQVRYAGFIPRGCATLMDLCLTMLLVMPLFALLTPFIYGDQSPQQQLQIIIAEAMHTMQQDSTPPSFSKVVSYVMQSPRSYEYFIAGGMLARIMLDQFLQLAFFAALFLLCWIKLSTTPGKMLLSLKIVDATTHAPMTARQSIIRSLGYLVSMIPLGLGFVWAAFDGRKQGWHDKLAHTVVIKN